MLTSDFRVSLKFFSWHSFSPVPLSNTWNAVRFTGDSENDRLRPVPVPSRVRTYLYIFTRALIAVTFISVIRLIYLTYEGYKSTGIFPFVDFLSLALWLLMFPPLACSDYMITSRGSLLRSIMVSMDLCDKIWETTIRSGKNQKALDSFRKRKSLQVFRLLIHGSIVDFFTIINYSWNLIEDPNNDPAVVYPSIPYNDRPTVKSVFCFLSILNMAVVSGMWFFILCVPGIIVFNYKCTIQGLTSRLMNERDQNRVEAVLREYWLLQASISEVGRAGLTRLLFIYNFTVVPQQTIECLCIFTQIRAGASWEEYQFFLIDILYCTGLVLHGFYSLSTVAQASGEFFDAMKVALARPPTNPSKMRHLKSLQKVMKTFKPIQISIGPFHCRKNFLFVASSTYLNNIVNAALYK